MDETWVDPAAEWHGADADDIGHGRLGVVEVLCAWPHSFFPPAEACEGCGAAK